MASTKPIVGFGPREAKIKFLAAPATPLAVERT